MALLAGAVLLGLVLPAFLINLYFTAVIADRWPGLRRKLSGLFMACGAETSSCSIVARTPFARMFGGVPNVALGLLWCAALAGLAVYWMTTGRLVVPWPFLVIAAGTIAVAAYLVHALTVVLRQPCPL